jgi:nitronate monooxygenase
MIRTRFTEQFGLRHPIVCAPMALVAGGDLAIAVSAAGALGIVAGGYAGTFPGETDLESELNKARAQRVGAGFITWALAERPEALTTALAYAPACLFLSFGDPRPFAGKIHDSGVPLFCQVQSMAQVDLALEAGAAVVIAQGAEAGGHGGARSTFPFVPEVADYLKRRSPGTLLLAAGGVADGRGLAAALMLGADGVVAGTRFWATREALTPRSHTDKAIAANGDSTVRTRIMDILRGVRWPGEYSFRFLRNRLMAEWADREAEALRHFGSLAGEYQQARARDDLDVVAVVGGEAVGLIGSRPAAEQVIEEMVAQAAGLLRNGASLAFT